MLTPFPNSIISMLQKIPNGKTNSPPLDPPNSSFLHPLDPPGKQVAVTASVFGVQEWKPWCSRAGGKTHPYGLTGFEASNFENPKHAHTVGTWGRRSIQKMDLVATCKGYIVLLPLRINMDKTCHFPVISGYSFQIPSSNRCLAEALHGMIPQVLINTQWIRIYSYMKYIYI